MLKGEFGDLKGATKVRQRCRMKGDVCFLAGLFLPNHDDFGRALLATVLEFCKSSSFWFFAI